MIIDFGGVVFSIIIRNHCSRLKGYGLGGLSVAVPGEVAGSWKAHQAYGVLPWARLVMPSVILAEEGMPISSFLANYLEKKASTIKAEPSMS